MCSLPSTATIELELGNRFGNKYYENYDEHEVVPGRQRWVDYAQHEYNATQVPAEWHSWIHHIRKDPPPADAIMQSSSPSWKAVRKLYFFNPAITLTMGRSHG